MLGFSLFSCRLRPVIGYAAKVDAVQAFRVGVTISGFVVKLEACSIRLLFRSTQIS